MMVAAFDVGLRNGCVASCRSECLRFTSSILSTVLAGASPELPVEVCMMGIPSGGFGHDFLCLGLADEERTTVLIIHWMLPQKWLRGSSASMAGMDSGLRGVLIFKPQLEP